MNMRNAEKNQNWRMNAGIFGFFILLIVFGVSSPAAAEEASPVAQNAVLVTIKGVISNIDDIGPYVVHGTLLQLYSCENTGKIELKADSRGLPVPASPNRKFYIDGMGRMVPAGGLARTIFPDFGFFSFDKTKGLAPGGCYKICMMMLDNPYPGSVPVTGPDGKIREIMIPEMSASGSSQEIVIDLSKETLMVPDPANLPQDTYKKVNPPIVKDPEADFWK
jgi:hypothetical protein